MKDLKFKVYIGEKMINGQHKSDITIENVVAVVCPQFSIPHGKLNLSGKLYSQQTDCFWSIEQLMTYFCNWFEIIENKDRIVAEIHLNIQSLCKTFRGEQIIEIFGKIESRQNFKELRTFDI